MHSFFRICCAQPTFFISSRSIRGKRYCWAKCGFISVKSENGEHMKKKTTFSWDKLRGSIKINLSVNTLNHG